MLRKSGADAEAYFGSKALNRFLGHIVPGYLPADWAGALEILESRYGHSMEVIVDYICQFHLLEVPKNGKTGEPTRHHDFLYAATTKPGLLAAKDNYRQLTIYLSKPRRHVPDFERRMAPFHPPGEAMTIHSILGMRSEEFIEKLNEHCGIPGHFFLETEFSNDEDGSEVIEFEGDFEDAPAPNLPVVPYYIQRMLSS